MKLHTLTDKFLLSYKGVYSSGTVTWYINRFKPLLAEMSECEITEITIDDLRTLYVRLSEKKTLYDTHPHKGRKIKKSYSIHTLHTFARAWKRLFKWTVEEGYLDRNPAQRLQLPPLPTIDPKAISPENVIMLIQAVEANSTNPERDYAIIRFLTDTNARVGGVAGLTIDELNISERRAKVHEKGKGGKGKLRVVFFKHETVKVLKTWLKIRPKSDNDDRVFMLTESGIREMLDRMAKKVSVKGPHNPHAFRHGFAKGVLSQGANLAQVSQMMGHSSSSVTVDFYGQFAIQELQDFHDRYSWVPDSY